jgi:probable HAF family extracellular repeat protein
VAVANTGNLVAGNLIDFGGLPHAFLYSGGNQTVLAVPKGYTYAQALSMNNAGEIVGNLFASNNTVHGFAYYNGTMHDLGTLQNVGRSYANAVSDSGLVVGASTAPSAQNATVACIFPSTSLGLKPGYFASTCYSINGSSQVLVGQQGAGGINLFLYANGNLTSFSIAAAAPSSNTSAYVINNSGQFIGTLLTNSHPFLYLDGNVVDLTNVIGPTAVLLDINSSNVLVGTNQGQAFVYLGGTNYLLGRLTITGGAGWVLQTATGINDAGQIVGTGINPKDHVQHAFLLTPTGSGNPPSITTQPAPNTIKVSMNAVFKIVVKAQLGVQLQYRWQRLPSGTSVWANLTNTNVYVGVTTANLTINRATLAMSGDQFRCLVADNGGTTMSNAVSLQVQVAPSIYLQPEDTEVVVGTSAFFLTAVTANPAPTYQWQRLPAGSKQWANLKNSAVYTGVTTANLLIPSPTLAMSGDQFKCIIKNKLGTVTTTTAGLTVTP